MTTPDIHSCHHECTLPLCVAQRRIAELESQLKAAREDAARYQWLRDNKHLDIWWSIEGPESRIDNIDADIDGAMANHAAMAAALQGGADV